MYATRPATEADAPFLWDLHRRTMRDSVDRTWGWVEADQQAYFRRGFAPAHLQVLVVEGQDVGMLRVDRRPDCLFLASLEIAPERQGRGLGTAILRDLLAEASRAGLPLRLQVLKVNPAKRLYERLGLRVTGETSTHFLMEAAMVAEQARVVQEEWENGRMGDWGNGRTLRS